MPDSSQFYPVADAQKPFFAGIDVGGTNIKIGLVDDLGRTIAYHTIPTEAERGPEDATCRMAEGVALLVEQAGISMDDVARVGLATPGPLTLDTGMLLTPGNLPGWWNFPIRDRVSQHCGKPVRYANDANAAAYGEYWRGAAADCHSMVLLTLGTGIGGGIVVRDLLIEGAYGCGSECGHILIDSSPDARCDSLDKAGSLEAYCGAYGVVGRANDLLDTGVESLLAQVRAAGNAITPLDIAQAAEAGDAIARQVVMDTARYLALGLVTLIHTIDPDSVVLGGAMNFGGAGHPLGEEFLQHIVDEVRPRLLPALQETLNISFAKLGGDAGYIGAAGLARLEHHAAS
ncbi:MAG: ROK family protein [Planctomycetes bacterium]|nr:ROK family protein [Planctomycetota bacterium]